MYALHLVVVQGKTADSAKGLEAPLSFLEQSLSKRTTAFLTAVCSLCCSLILLLMSTNLKCPIRVRQCKENCLYCLVQPSRAVNCVSVYFQETVGVADIVLWAALYPAFLENGLKTSRKDSLFCVEYRYMLVVFIKINSHNTIQYSCAIKTTQKKYPFHPDNYDNRKVM